jgi:predicted RNA-binding Zn-ribbon protein involved in translation (DUF1610 family)
MTLPEQLRAIADRLEELDHQRSAVTEELLVLVGDRFAILDGWDEPADSASVPRVAGGAGATGGEDRASVAASPSAPIEQPAASFEDRDGAGSAPSAIRTPARRTSPGTNAGAVRVKRTPADQAGDAGSTPAPRSTPSARSLLPTTDRAALPGVKIAPGQSARFDVLTCPTCGKELKRQGYAPHMRLRHGRIVDHAKSGTCPDCGKAIARHSNLARHRQQVHGGQKRASTNGGAPVIRKGSESWVCARCPESFATREARDAHQAKHPPVPMPNVGQRPANSPSEAAQRILRGGHRRVTRSEESHPWL